MNEMSDIPRQFKSVVALTCGWCAGDDERKREPGARIGAGGYSWRSEAEVVEHFLMKHGKDEDALRNYGLSRQDAIALAEEWGIDEKELK